MGARHLVGTLWAVAALAGCSGSPDLEPAPKEPAPLPAPDPQPEPTTAATVVLPAAPYTDDAIRSAREAAQRRLLTAEQPLQPDLRAPPASGLPGGAQVLGEGELPGFFAALEHPEGQAPLGHMERALAELESGSRGEPVRFAFYGASGTAADLWTGYVRAYLQERFGDGGPGFTFAAKPRRWSRHQELLIESSKHWTRHNAYRIDPGSIDEPKAQFGVMGQVLDTTSKFAWTQISPKSGSRSETTLARYELHYLLQEDGGSIWVKLDGKRVATVSTDLGSKKARAHALEPGSKIGVLTVRLEPGEAHVLRLGAKGDGPIRLLGVVAETERPGVVLDTLGVIGAKATNMMVWDEQMWAQHLESRLPDLVMMAFGNNEAADEDEPIGEYETGYRAVMQRLEKVAPEASCIIMGPGDFPKRVRPDGTPAEHGDTEFTLELRPRLAEIEAVQRKIALEFGCAYLDPVSILGGQGAKHVWVEAGLGKDDYLHLTREGYVRLGTAVADAMLHRYDWATRGDWSPIPGG